MYYKCNFYIFVLVLFNKFSKSRAMTYLWKVFYKFM